MFVVIFTAKLAQIDVAYRDMAAQLRQRAHEQYGCIEFVSRVEGDEETTLSYWERIEDIEAWKSDPLHCEAKGRGKRDWYQYYKVEIAEIKSGYGSDLSS